LETGAGEAVSAAVYRLLLRLFSDDFRRRWEEELVYTFELQLADSWFDAWRCALVELGPISLVELSIPLVSLAGTAALYFGLTWALMNGPLLRSLDLYLFATCGG
jgi:hypothetical protein